MKEGRAQSLLRLVRQHGWTRGVELGLWRGATTGYLLERHPDLMLIGVDRWERTFGPPKNKITGECDYSDKDMAGAEAECRALADRFPGRLTLHKCSTLDAAARVPDASQDFVFIDASHKTADVVRDFCAWWPKIKTTGALLGHDADWPAIKTALGSLEYEVLPGNVWCKWYPEEELRELLGAAEKQP